MPDQDVLKGKIKQGAGKVQEKAGELTGNTRDQVRGADKQAEGKLQEGVGHAKDAIRDVADAIKR
jgi:uncharacterized protein YjbJ (UPF0337 family)